MIQTLRVGEIQGDQRREITLGKCGKGLEELWERDEPHRTGRI